MNKRVALALAVVAALTTSWPTVAAHLARALIVRSNPSAADAVILLSGSAAQAERVSRTVELYREGRVPRIFLTNDGVRGGWSRPRQSNPMMFERARDALLAAGIPQDSIVLLPETVRSTYDEARALRAYLSRHPLGSVLVVTSGYHSRRALWVFRRALSDTGTVIGIDPAPPGIQTPLPDEWWLTRRGWSNVAAEYPKLGYYFVRYR